MVVEQAPVAPGQPPLRLGNGTRAGFSVGQVAGQLFRDVPSLLLLYFLTNVMGIPPAIAGAAIFLPKVIFAVIFDLLVGVTSDRLALRFARRNWLLLGGLAAPFAMIGPFAVPDGGTGLQVGWVFVTFSFYMAVYSAFSVPYLAQFSEISQDPVERAELMGWKHGFTGLGVLMSSSVAPLLVSALGGGRMAHIGAMGAMGLVCLACLVSAWWYSRRIQPPMRIARDFAIRDLGKAFANPKYLILCLSAVIMTVGAGISYATFPFFIKFLLKSPNPLQFLGLVTALMAVAVMISSPLWVQLSKHIGKKNCYVLAAASHGVLTLLWGFAGHFPMALIYVVVFLYGAANAGWGTMVLAMLSDCIARAQQDQGENCAGSYSAIWSMIEKVGIALGGTLIVGGLLGAYGFDAVAAKDGIAQTPQALFGVLMAYSIIPGLAKLVAAAIIWRFVHDA